MADRVIVFAGGVSLVVAQANGGGNGAATNLTVQPMLWNGASDARQWYTSGAIADATTGVNSAAVSVMVYNGTNWGRQRTVVNATDSTGTGITAAGLVAQFDDVSPQTVSENQFGNVRMSANGVVKVGPSSDAGLNAVLVDDAGFTVATSTVVPMGALADQTSPDSVDEGDVGIPRMTLDRRLLS